MDPIVRAILSTLVYADIFDCALTLEEIFVKLQNSQAISFPDFRKQITYLIESGKIITGQGFYCLPGKEKLLEKSSKCIDVYNDKIDIIRRNLGIFSRCPWVEAVYLTGSLAAKNSAPDDDIDLLIITKPQRLWLTRIWLLFQLERLGLRRRPSDLLVNNKFCLNLFLETESLPLSYDKQSRYTAHEIVQAVPLFIRDKTGVNIFLSANPWVKRYLPQTQLPNQPILDLPVNNLTSHVMGLINRCCYVTQRLYMQSRLTKESITYNTAFFHPRRLSITIEKRFKTGKRRINLI